MAPAPPPAGASLQQRLLHLANSLQFAWFTGHVFLLGATLRFALSYLTLHGSSRAARFSYRTAFVSAAVTYGIVVYKSLASRYKAGKLNGGGALQIISDENVQYLLMALIWLFSYQIPLAVFPFAVYSIFHVATYTRSNLLPAISPAPAANSATAAASAASPSSSATNGRPKSNSPLADTIGRFVKEYYDTSMTVVAGLEILLWFRLFFPALLFYKGTWILLGAYTIFLRARFAQSTFVQGAFTQVGARVDGAVNRQDMPPAVRQGWASTKGALNQGVQATDLGRYVNSSQGQGPVKKAQ